jgi:hypothetical protein
MNLRNLRLSAFGFRRLSADFKIFEKARSKASRQKKYSTVLSLTSHERRKVLNHFPYSLIYVVDRELIVILSVAHQKRRPRY